MFQQQSQSIYNNKINNNNNNTPDFLINQNNYMFFNNNANIPSPLPSNKMPYTNKYINNYNNNNYNNYIDENNIINSLSNLINSGNNNLNNSNNNLNNNDYNVPNLSPQINNIDLYSSSSSVQTLNNNNNNNNSNTQSSSQSPSQSPSQSQSLNFPQYCSLKKCELCNRGQPPLLLKTPTWSSIMRVVFFTLHNEYPDKEYFSLKTEVYEFMTSHWERLCINRKRTDNWRKQIQDMLSHSKNVFESGLEKLKQNGFWKLRTISDPWVINEVNTSLNSSPSITSNNSSPWRKKRNHEDNEESADNQKKLRTSNESINCSQVPSSPLGDQSAPELESSIKEIDQVFSKEIQSIRFETKKIFKLLPTIKRDNEKLKSIQQTLSLFENRLIHLEKEKENIKISSPSLSFVSEPSSPLQQTPSSPSQPNSRSTSPLPLQRITNSTCTNNNNNNNNNNNSNQKLFFI